MSYILLLEPNTLLAQTYARGLEHAGFVVQHVATAQEAIDVADKATPAVVVLELQLPLHSGIEFLHEFRSYTEWRSVPVVVNTLIPPGRLSAVGHALEHDLGALTVLYKPHASLQNLIQAVRAQLTPAAP
jgi:DNA-binding response OmpR family regulator